MKKTSIKNNYLNKVLTKIPAFIGTLFSITSIILVLLSLIFINEQPPKTEVAEGVFIETYSKTFVYWIFSVIIALIGLFILLIDGIISLYNVIKCNDVKLNLLLTISPILGIVTLYAFGSGENTFSLIVWNIIHLIIISVEIIGIIKPIKKYCEIKRTKL